MRFSTLILFCSLISLGLTNQLSAQVDILVDHSTVGLGPGEVIADTIRNQVHVMTSGQDVNFNGHFEPDSGDVSAGWYVLDSKGNVIDSTFFEGFFNNFPVRVGADLEKGLLYLPLHGRVQAYNMERLALVVDTVVNQDVVAVSYESQTDRLILSTRAADFISPGQVQVFDIESGFMFGEIVSGINPGMAVSDVEMMNGRTSTYILNEGSFGVKNASLTRLSFAPDIFKSVNEEEIGGGATQILYDEEGERLFILIPRAGLVRILDPKTHRELEESPINLNNPSDSRSLTVDGNSLWVSSWSGAVQQYSIGDGSEQRYQLPGKGEGVATLNDRLFVAISYATDSFDPDSTLVVFDLQTHEPMDTLVVGLNPVEVFANPLDNGIVIMGSGGDGVEPWWKEIDAETFETRGSGSLPASVNNPVQGAFDQENTTFAVIGGDTLYVLDLKTDTDRPYPLYVGSQELFSHVADAADHWLVTNTPGDFVPEPGCLYAIDKKTGERVASIMTSVSIPMVPGEAKRSAEGGFGAYAISVVGYGGSAAELVHIDYHPNLFEDELGNGANHILHEVDEYGNGITAVTMNGSHEVVFLELDSDTPEISLRVPTGTEGFDGPRTSALAPCVPVSYEGALLVTTYSGEVLFLAHEEVLIRKEIGGKGEGIVLLNDTAFVANPFETVTYNPASTVAIVTLEYWGSVDDIERVVSSISAYPNPANASGTIVLSLEEPVDVELKLYDPLGRLHKELFTGRLEAGVNTLPFDVRDLEAGTYFYRLQVDEKSVTQLLEVVR